MMKFSTVWESDMKWYEILNCLNLIWKKWYEILFSLRIWYVFFFFIGQICWKSDMLKISYVENQICWRQCIADSASLFNPGCLIVLTLEWIKWKYVDSSDTGLENGLIVLTLEWIKSKVHKLGRELIYMLILLTQD